MRKVKQKGKNELEKQQLTGELRSKVSEPNLSIQGWMYIQIDVLPLAGARHRLLREELALQQPGTNPPAGRATTCQTTLQKIIFCYSGNMGLTFTVAKPN